MIVPLNPQQSGLMKEASRAVEKPSLCRVKKGEPAAGRPSKCFPLTSARRILRHIYKDWCPRTFWLLMSSKHSEAVWLVFLSSLQLYWKVSLFYQWIHDYRPWIQDHHPSRLMTTSPLVFPSLGMSFFLPPRLGNLRRGQELLWGPTAPGAPGTGWASVVGMASG